MLLPSFKCIRSTEPVVMIDATEWKHRAVYEDELKRIWPLHEQDREAKIAKFAKEYGFRMRFYRKGLCAIFDKNPPKRRL